MVEPAAQPPHGEADVEAGLAAHGQHHADGKALVALEMADGKPTAGAKGADAAADAGGKEHAVLPADQEAPVKSAGYFSLLRCAAMVCCGHAGGRWLMHSAINKAAPGAESCWYGCHDGCLPAAAAAAAAADSTTALCSSGPRVAA